MQQGLGLLRRSHGVEAGDGSQESVILGKVRIDKIGIDKVLGEQQHAAQGLATGVSREVSHQNRATTTTGIARAGEAVEGLRGPVGIVHAHGRGRRNGAVESGGRANWGQRVGEGIVEGSWWMRRGRAIQVGRHRILGRRGRLRRGKGILRRRGTGGDRSGALSGTVGPRAGTVRLTRTTTHALQSIEQWVNDEVADEDRTINKDNAVMRLEDRRERISERWLRTDEILYAIDGLGGARGP